MEKTKFNVLYRNFNTRKVEPYDVLPYFRREWEDEDASFDRDKVNDKESLKGWIKRASHYMYWGRCEYEFLIGSWPFGGKKLIDEMTDFISTNPNLKDYKQNIDFTNIIIRDMYKIDIHEQIMYNIDIITDILYKEFFKDE